MVPKAYIKRIISILNGFARIIQSVTKYLSRVPLLFGAYFMIIEALTKE